MDPRIVFTVLVGVLIGMIIVMLITMPTVRIAAEKIAVCEKDLPRSQRCVLSAVPVTVSKLP